MKEKAREVNLLGKYAKFALAIVATVLTAVVGFAGGGITDVEWVNVAIAGVGAASVFAAPNVPGSRYTKSVLAVLAAVLAFLTSAIIGGISPVEWGQIGILVLGALGIYAVPNKGGTVEGAQVDTY